MTGDIFILVSSETGSWKLESDLKREGKIRVCGCLYCMAIGEQRWLRPWETSKQTPWSHFSSRMNKLNEDSSFKHNQRKLIICGSMYRAQRGRGPSALTSDWMPFLVLSAHSKRAIWLLTWAPHSSMSAEYICGQLRWGKVFKFKSVRLVFKVLFV